MLPKDNPEYVLAGILISAITAITIIQPGSGEVITAFITILGGLVSYIIGTRAIKNTAEKAATKTAESMERQIVDANATRDPAQAPAPSKGTGRRAPARDADGDPYHPPLRDIREYKDE